MSFIKLLKKPEFYDLFGLPVFAFILCVALWSLSANAPLPPWVNYLLLFIGVAGIIIDGNIVYRTFVK